MQDFNPFFRRQATLLKALDGAWDPVQAQRIAGKMLKASEVADKLAAAAFFVGLGFLATRHFRESGYAAVALFALIFIGESGKHKWEPVAHKAAARARAHKP